MSRFTSPLTRPLYGSITALIAAFVVPLATPSASGATLTWDSNPSLPDIQDGSGTWNTAANNWFDGGNVLWADGNDAVFGNIADGSFAITVALNPNATSLSFSTSGYTLSAAAAQTIALSKGASAALDSIVVAAGKTATIGANVTISTASTVDAAGTTVTGVNSSSSITGGGTLIIDNGGIVKNSGSINSNALHINSTVDVRTGGTLTTATNGNAIFVNGNLNVTGGTVTAIGTLGIGQVPISGAAASAGTLTISSGIVTATSNNGVRFGAGSATPGGTVNLDGGTLRAQFIAKGTGTVDMSIVNFNGGTLMANATSNTFMQGLSRANVRNGGAIFHTNNVNIVVNQPLLHSDIAGDSPIDGGLFKMGLGTLTLNGDNTYNGPTHITGGTLILNGNNSGYTGPVTFGAASVATLELGNAEAIGSSSLITSVGSIQLRLANSITLDNEIRLVGAGANGDGALKSNSGNNTLTDFGMSGGGGTRIHVAAGSTLNLPNAITLGAGGSAQSLRIIGAGTLFLGGDNSAVVNPGSSFILGSGSTAGPTIRAGNDLAFGSGTIDFQTGANATISSNDMTARTFANPLKFSATGANVNQATFGATGTGDLTFTGPVALSGNLEATIQNTTTTLSGGISGVASLTKLGTGTLVLDGFDLNSYSGGTTVSAGVLDVKKDDGLGFGDVSVGSGAKLKLELAISNNYISDTGKLLLAAGSTVELAFTGAPDTISALSFDGGNTFAAVGIWGAPGSGAQFTSAFFTGTGTLNVLVPEPNTAILLAACAGFLGLRRRRTAE